MSPELAYTILNAAVMPWWAVWLAAPRSALAARLASHAAIFIALGAIYTVLLGAGMVGSGAGEESAGMGGFGYESVRQALGTPLVFLAGWTHYLAFDLFAGAWVVREARRLDLEPRVFLLFTLLAGPLGLGAFLARRAWRLRSLGALGEVDLA